MRNKSIRCDVETCKYCDCKKKYCMLPSISVVNSKDNSGSKEFAMCDSYKER